MASAKRQRHRANRVKSPVKTSSKELLEKRTDILIDAEIHAHTRKDKIQKTAGSLAKALFYAGLAFKVSDITAATAPTGVDVNTLPRVRGILPEPFDVTSHVGNVFWTQTLIWLNLPGIKRMANENFGLDHIRSRLYGTERPNILHRAAIAAGTGVALHTAVETISEFAPGTVGELMGGFDPIDVAYGGLAAAVISGYDMVRRRNAIDTADQQLLRPA